MCFYLKCHARGCGINLFRSTPDGARIRRIPASLLEDPRISEKRGLRLAAAGVGPTDAGPARRAFPPEAGKPYQRNVSSSPAATILPIP